MIVSSVAQAVAACEALEVGGSVDLEFEQDLGTEEYSLLQIEIDAIPGTFKMDDQHSTIVVSRTA